MAQEFYLLPQPSRCWLVQMSDIANLSWNEIAKGLVGIAGGLAAMTVALKLLPDKNVFQAVSFVILAAGMKIIASAVGDMAKLGWGDIAKGLVGLAGSLLIMVVALKALPLENMFQAVALLVLAAALKVLSLVLCKTWAVCLGRILAQL
jgi:hypothetical protein